MTNKVCPGKNAAHVFQRVVGFTDGLMAEHVGLSPHNCDTKSVLYNVLQGGSRLCAYAHHAKKQGLTYLQFVEMLEVTRRDVMKTPDGILMNPECNERLDLVAITDAWNRLVVGHIRYIYMRK